MTQTGNCPKIIWEKQVIFVSSYYILNLLKMIYNNFFSFRFTVYSIVGGWEESLAVGDFIQYIWFKDDSASILLSRFHRFLVGGEMVLHRPHR